MSLRPNKLIQSLLLISLDVITLSVAFLITYHIRTHLTIFVQIQPLAEYFGPALIVIGISILIFMQQGLYRDVRDLSMLEEYTKIIKSLTYAFVIALGITFFMKFYEKSRVLVLLFWMMAVIASIAVRFIYYQVLKRLRARGWNQTNVAVVGSEKNVKAIRHLLKQYAQLGYHAAVSVVLPKGSYARTKNFRRLVDHEILSRYQKQEIELVIVSDTVKNYKHILEINEIFNEYAIPHRNVNEAFDLVGFKTTTTEGLEGIISSLDEGRIGGGRKALKRFFDEMIAISITLLTLPLWLLIVIIIKLDSKGPVLFRQERVGYQGRKFLMYKFRSMHIHTPKYATTPIKQKDPRVTRVGGFLRRTSLDELPQLINVIKGDMSLVGPRPEMPFIVEKYKPIYRYRFLVLPGITGLWQVSGRTEKPLEENIKYDLYYIKNQTFLLDFVIILRTLPAVVFGKGAY